MSRRSGGVVAIYRYPVKGLSPEKMDRVVLTPGECLPHDRRFAIALGSTRFDQEHPEWLPKTRFIILMRDEKLTRLRTHFDVESGVLAIAENGRVLLRAQITAAKGCELVAEFFTNFLGDATKGPLRVVAAPGYAFADARRKPNATTDQYVSLINRASLAALEAAMGVPIDPIRFRANIYFDGPSAWSEHDWIDSEIAIGAARLRVVSPITRWAATQVNPATAEQTSISSQPRAFFRPHQYGCLCGSHGGRRNCRWRYAAEGVQYITAPSDACGQGESGLPPIAKWEGRRYPGACTALVGGFGWH